LNADVDGNHILQHTSQYRTGLWNMMMAERTLSEQAELHLVSHVPGNVDNTFNEVDKDGSGFLDETEIREVLVTLRKDAGGKEESVTPAMVAEIFKEISTKVKSWDSKKPNEVSLTEFRLWYADSEHRIRDQVTAKFSEIDTDGSGKLDREEIRELLLSGKGKAPTEDEIDALWKEMLSNDREGGESDQLISLNEFLSWYNDSEYFTAWLELQTNETDAVPLDLSFPSNSGPFPMIL